MKNNSLPQKTKRLTDKQLLLQAYEEREKKPGGKKTKKIGQK